MSAASSIGWSRSLLFASGDFACNLYWQSITFYLLFFYTDTLGLSAAMAGLITMVASVWDGLAGLLIGVFAGSRDPRWFVRYGAVPLALSFVLIYLALPLTGLLLAGAALAAHMLFRTLYVAVNVPYAAMTVQIASDSAGRARIAGLRMILGAAAALAVAGVTQRCIGLLGPHGYAAAAALFGVFGTLLLLMVGAMRAPRPTISDQAAEIRLRDIVAVIGGNAAFRRLNLAICCAVASMAVLMRAIPYYFKYEVGDTAAGSTALAMMSVAGVLAVPVWMACAARFGHRVQWQASAAVAALALAALLGFNPRSAAPAQALFVLYFGAAQGLFYGFWALIPDVVEHGGDPGRPRMDVLLFAVAALLQKVTMGIAVAIFGALLSAIGYAPRLVQPPLLLRDLALVSAVLPLAAMVLAGVAMARFPRLRASEAAGA